MYKVWTDVFFSNGDKCISVDDGMGTVAYIDADTHKLVVCRHRFVKPERPTLTYDKALSIREKRFPCHCNNELPKALQEALKTAPRWYRLIGVDECGDEYTIIKVLVNWEDFDNYDFFLSLKESYNIPDEHQFYWEVERNYY